MEELIQKKGEMDTAEGLFLFVCMGEGRSQAVLWVLVSPAGLNGCLLTIFPNSHRQNAV